MFRLCCLCVVCFRFLFHVQCFMCVVVEEVEGAQGCVWLCLYVRARVRVVREGEDECERDSMCSYVLSCAWQQSCCRRCTLDTPRTTSKLSRWRLNRSYLPGRIQTACVGLNRVGPTSRANCRANRRANGRTNSRTTADQTAELASRTRIFTTAKCMDTFFVAMIGTRTGCTKTGT